MNRIKHLWLEITNRCNANCIFCGRQWALPPMDMTLEFFKSIIDQFKKPVKVQTQGFGEPLLHLDIVEMVKYANSKGHHTIFYTNGSLLTPELSQQLLDAKLDRIIFSVDACTKEQYEYFRRGLRWDTLLTNMIMFKRLRDKALGKSSKLNYAGVSHANSTFITARMCETVENKNAIPEIKRFWDRYVDVVTSAPEVDIPPPHELKITPHVNYKPMDCKFPYEYLSVKSNGDVVMCCRDWFHVYVIGNLHDKSVKEIWKDIPVNQIRSSYKSGKNIPYLCKICKTARTPTRQDMLV